MKNLNYLKYYEEYLLKPHRNYNERDKYAKEKILKILNNKTYFGDLDLSDNKYPNIKNLNKLEYLTGDRTILDISYNNILTSLKPLKSVHKIQALKSVIEDIGYIDELPYLILNHNKKIKSLGKYIKNIWFTHLQYTNIENLGNLEEVYTLYLLDSLNIKSLYPLKKASYLSLLHTNIEDISSIENSEKVQLVISSDTKIPKKQYKKFKYTIV